MDFTKTLGNAFDRATNGVVQGVTRGITAAGVNTVKGAISNHETPSNLIQPGTEVRSVKGGFFQDLPHIKEAYGVADGGKTGYSASIGTNEQGEKTYTIKAGYDLKDKTQAQDFREAQSSARAQDRNAENTMAVPGRAATGAVGQTVNGVTHDVTNSIRQGINGIFGK